MRIQLSDHFNYGKLIRFVIPSIFMMIVTSIYGVVDGLFVSNFVGKTPFAALNLIMPIAMIIAAIGFMLGAGGSAVVSQTLGKGDKKKANEYFSMLTYITIAIGIILSIIVIVFTPEIAILLGATNEMIEHCVVYGRIIFAALPFFMLQNLFQSFLITAEKPNLGLIVTIAAGLTNVILDALFIIIFKWGLAGAALATGLSQAVGAIIPLFYFIKKKNTSLLRLTRAKFHGRVFAKSCTNGSSELFTNISTSLVSVLFNFQLMRMFGENGVAAYGVIMYVNFIFTAIYIGFSMGTAPIVGYNFGAKNNSEVKNLLKKSMIIITLLSLILFGLSELTAPILSKIFVGYDSELLTLTTHAFRIYSISFLFMGFGVFASSFFTSLGNGLISAVISILRTFAFQVICVLVLPIVLGADGIWYSVAVAEGLALIFTFIFLVAKNKQYNYL